MKLLFLYIVLLIWVGYEMVPYDSIPLDMFPFSSTQLPFKTWLYFFLEHTGIIMLCYILAMEATTYRYATKVFFYLQVADLIDYVMTYNTQWFTFFGIPITFNILSAICFSFVILKEYDRTNR